MIIRTKRDFYSEGIFLGHLSKLLREGGHVKGGGGGIQYRINVILCINYIGRGEIVWNNKRTITCCNSHLTRRSGFYLIELSQTKLICHKVAMSPTQF